MSTNPVSHAPSSPSDSPNPPPTPVSPNPAGGITASDEAGRAAQGGPVRRKASRRANTAERRATHNAVERQRRETLNGRFLDLAALLPNLASVRRPSKSAIVNSSIALIHTQRRARAIAGRELRILKSETDALRRELNEWRDRATLPRVDEPPRSGDFLSLLTLEEEEMGEDERRAYEMRDRDDGDDDLIEEDELPEANIRISQQQIQQYNHQQQLAQLAAQQQQQRMSIHTAGISAFDSVAAAAALYDSQAMSTPVSALPSEADKAAWNSLYSTSQQQQQWQALQAAQAQAQAQAQVQATLFTTQSTGHGGASNGGAPQNSFVSGAGQTFLTNYPRQNSVPSVAPAINSASSSNGGSPVNGGIQLFQTPANTQAGISIAKHNHTNSAAATFANIAALSTLTGSPPAQDDDAVSVHSSHSTGSLHSLHDGSVHSSPSPPALGSGLSLSPSGSLDSSMFAATAPTASASVPASTRQGLSNFELAALANASFGNGIGSNWLAGLSGATGGLGSMNLPLGSMNFGGAAAAAGNNLFTKNLGVQMPIAAGGGMGGSYPSMMMM